MIGFNFKALFTASLLILGSLLSHAINWADYDHLDPSHRVPTEALKQAVNYYDMIKNKINNPYFLTVIDYSKHSGKPRFHLINMKTGNVTSLKVAHGKGSDSNHDGWAEKFSNADGSLATSLGFFLTSEPYPGENGYSLRLDGLSKTNSNARKRAIVVHGAAYVNDKLAVIGRSWGCPALDTRYSTHVIETIKNGSLIFSWGGPKQKLETPVQKTKDIDFTHGVELENDGTGDTENVSTLETPERSDF